MPETHEVTVIRRGNRRIAAKKTFNADGSVLIRPLSESEQEAALKIWRCEMDRDLGLQPSRDLLPASPSLIPAAVTAPRVSVEYVPPTANARGITVIHRVASGPRTRQSSRPGAPMGCKPRGGFFAGMPIK